jgi:hypothetical protein
MKIRSKDLWQYLNDTGALNGNEEDIIQAKREYRKAYKCKWKKNRHLPRKEMRPYFSLREYREICLKAHDIGVKPTAYVKMIVLSIVNEQNPMHSNEAIRTTVQQVSIVLNSLLELNDANLVDTIEVLTTAESTLLNLIRQN